MHRIRPIALLIALALPPALAGCVERKAAEVIAPGNLRVVNIAASPETVLVSGQSQISAVVDNPSGTKVSYYWQAYRGVVAGTGSNVTYFGSYCCAGTDWVVLTVENEEGEKATEVRVLTVLTQ